MIARLSRHRISRFAFIGMGATFIYAAAAFLLSVTLPAAAASLTAYATAAIFSYAGHKYVTFASAGAHVFEAPRFGAVTAIGLVFAWLLPKLLVDGFGLVPAVPIVVTCIVVPLINYVVLGRWVFASGMASAARSR